jgi:MFS family permease
MEKGMSPLIAVSKSQRRSVKRWLRYATWEGAFANVFITYTGGAFITGLALMMGANDFWIGFLAAVPFISQVAQLASAYTVAGFRNRKESITILSGIGRQIWWLIALLVFLGGQRRLEFLVAVVVLSNIAVMTATPGWVSWMADIVPEKFRGRYFGVRNAVLAIVTTVTALAGGLILDSARARQHENVGFGIILVISCSFAAAALIMLNRIPDPYRREGPIRFSWSDLLEPLRNNSFRRLLKVFFVWNVSIGIAAPFFAPHMLANLRMSFTLVSLYSGLTSLSAIILNKRWGTLIDRFGSRPVIAVCALGVGIIPFVWLFPRADFLWVLGIEAIYTGALWTGFNLAAFNIPIANSPRKNRACYLAVFNVITGLGFFSASLAGGVLAETWKNVSWALGPQKIVNYHLLFVISGLLRMIAAGLMLTFHETGEKGIPIMMQFMGYAILKRISVGRQLLLWLPRRTKK